MQSEQIIIDLITDGHFEEAISALDRNIEEDSANPRWWYLRGKAYWRTERYAAAISDYEESAHLDPHSEGAQALEFARDIMNFYNTDLLNP